MLKPLFICLLGVLSVGLSLLLRDEPVLILISLTVLGMVLLVLAWSTRALVRFIAAALLIPLLFDLPATDLGLWSFAHQDFFGIPFWLPLLYGNVAVAILYVKEAAVRVLGKRAL